MSEEITLNHPVSVMEELHCFICRGYLSSSPVLLLPNGNYICGRCAPLNTETPVHRLLPFESLLRKQSFPCIFKKHGCTELLLFGKTAEHESKCEHKPFGCPINVFATCPWEGNVTQFLQHFEDAHSSFIKEKSQFQLEINKDVQGVLMAVNKSLPFIVKYSYKGEERILHYDVRSCGNKNGDQVSWKLQLINDSNMDCNINLKTNECLSYDESFCGVENGKILDVTKFLENLGDPNSIKVAVNFKIVELNFNGATIDLIGKLKCSQCCNYLVPPLFDLNGKVICCDCSEYYPACKPSEDQNLLEHVEEAMCPCKWRGCNFVGKSNILKNHMMNCEFRRYHCVYTNCEVTFLFEAAADHLKTEEDENTVYMPNKIIYQTSFERDYDPKDVISIVNNIIFFIQHNMETKDSVSERSHEISIHCARDNLNDISAIATFEHMHCKLTKEILIPELGLEVYVCLSELPLCFLETDELTVTIDVIV